MKSKAWFFILFSKLSAWSRRLADQSVFQNSLFLIANTIAGSLLGFLFWMVSARVHSQGEVGIGAAYINAITLIAMIADMGLGIVIIRFLSEMGRRQTVFINSIMLTVSFFSIVVGFVFVLGIPLWAPDLRVLTKTFLPLVLFMGSALAFSLAQVLDRVYIASLKAYYLFLRNLAAGIVRVASLVILDPGLGSLAILISIGLGAALTLLASLVVFLPKTITGFRPHFQFSFQLLWEKSAYTISNHASQLLFGLTPLLYPLIVLHILGPEDNAQFYISWMISNLLFIIPLSVSTSTFAKVANSVVPEPRQILKSLAQTLLGLTVAVPVLILLGPGILRIFGAEYIAASKLLTLLSISALPYSVNIFAVTYYRLQSDLKRLLLISGIPTVLSLIVMTLGGMLWQLPGVGAGWLLSQALGAAFSIILIRRRRSLTV